MKELIRLINLKKKRSQRVIQLIDHNFRKSEVSRDNQLYQAIESGLVKDDLDGAFHLLQTEPENRNYRNIKIRLKEKLLNHLFFLDYSRAGSTNYQESYYQSLKEVFQIKILLMEDELETALKLTKQTIKITDDFQFLDLSITLCKILREVYSERGALKKLNQISSKIKILQQKQLVADRAEEIYFQSLAALNKTRTTQKKQIAKLPQLIEEIGGLNSIYHLTKVNILQENLQIIYNQLNGFYQQNIEICTRLEKRFLNRPLNLIRVDLDPKRIAFVKSFSFLMELNKAEGIAYGFGSIGLFSEDSIELIAFIEYVFLLAIKTGKYEEAEKLWLNAYRADGMKELPNLEKERWEIYRYYLIFFGKNKSVTRGFDKEEFLDLKPLYPAEKEGYNIAYLIIQLLFLLRDGEVASVTNKIEELEEYSSPVLSKKRNYRNSIFIRMLRIIIDQDFSYFYAHEKALGYLKKLNTTKVEADFFNFIEVIPFEKLWMIILEHLKHHKNYTDYRFYNL